MWVKINSDILLRYSAYSSAFYWWECFSLGVSGIIESCATMVDSPSVQRQLTQCPIAKGEGWRRFAVSKLQKDADII